MFLFTIESGLGDSIQINILKVFNGFMSLTLSNALAMLMIYGYAFKKIFGFVGGTFGLGKAQSPAMECSPLKAIFLGFVDNTK